MEVGLKDIHLLFVSKINNNKKTYLQCSISADKAIPLFQSEVKFLILQSGKTAYNRKYVM